MSNNTAVLELEAGKSYRLTKSFRRNRICVYIYSRDDNFLPGYQGYWFRRETPDGTTFGARRFLFARDVVEAEEI